MKNKAPIIILRASKQPYLSIGVRFGGVKAFNAEYKYFLNNDVFVRKDYASKYNQHLKQGNSFRSFVELVKSIENESIYNDLTREELLEVIAGMDEIISELGKLLITQNK